MPLISSCEINHERTSPIQISVLSFKDILEFRTQNRKICAVVGQKFSDWQLIRANCVSGFRIEVLDCKKTQNFPTLLKYFYKVKTLNTHSFEKVFVHTYVLVEIIANYFIL